MDASSKSFIDEKIAIMESGMGVGMEVFWGFY